MDYPELQILAGRIFMFMGLVLLIIIIANRVMNNRDSDSR